jgi:hypothetical protein
LEAHIQVPSLTIRAVSSYIDIEEVQTMRNDFKFGECVAVIGSMTQAMRAQSILASAAIRTNVIKADSSKTGGGCAYALSYSCEQEDNVRSVLFNAGIRPQGFYGGLA